MEPSIITKKKDRMMSEPAIEVFQMQHDEFLFLGIEYSLQNPDMKKIWDNFIHAGGYEMVEQYHKKPYGCMIVNHNNNPEYDIYFIGTIVEGMDEAPEGYRLTKFPAREFLVVTHEWLPTKDEAPGQIFRIDEAKVNVQMPDGYVRYDGPGSQIVLIERENFDTENGSRWENWVPIRTTNN